MQSFRSSPSKEDNSATLAAAGTDDELESSANKTDSSILSVLTNQFVSEASNIPKRLYCPFCLFDFGFDFLLKSHIRDVHHLEIRNFSRTKLDAFTFDPCCFCHAKFYVHGLLPKHVIRKHQESILALISHVNNDEHDVSCKFCPYKVSLKQLKLLFIHAENKHLKEFVQVLSAHTLTINGIPCDAKRKIDDVLDEEIQKLNLASNSKRSDGNEELKPILKRGSLYDDEGTSSAEANAWAPKTRRKLRFDLPDISISSSNNSDKENSFVGLRKKKFFGLKSTAKKPKIKLLAPNKIIPEPERRILGDITSSALKNFFPSCEEGIDTLDLVPFKCGICGQEFDLNTVLVKHVRRIHGRINFMPCYRCGMCKAKFFRNSYLLKHHKLHVKPKCLNAYGYKPLVD